MQYPIYSEKELIEQTAKSLKPKLEKINQKKIFNNFRIYWQWTNEEKYISIQFFRIFLQLGFIP
jgi:hypothetical protein